MSYNHQPQLSINSIQSLVEPVTPPLGQMNNKQNHQRTNSLDLSGFNQFMASNSPMNMGTLSPISGGLSSISSGSAMKPRIASLPLINEFDAASMASGVTLIPGNDQASVGSSSALSSLRTVSASTVGSVSNQGTSASSSVPAGAAALVVRSSSSVSSSASLSNGNCGGSGTGGGPSTGCSSTADLSSLSIEELDYLQLATDQYGCRFLQRKLENPEESAQVRDLMYQHIKPYLLDLILDPFGNYLIQKLCEYLTNDQKTMMIQDIYSHVFQISINQYGTRSLQKIIDTVETEQHIDMIVTGFSREYTSISQVLTLINDLNGNHVIQKCIFKFEPTKFDFIIDAIVEKDNIIKISTHKHGCCVLQKLLSVCTLQQIFKISVKIIQYLPGLINDQFGNYIIQFLFDIKELDFYLLGEIFGKLSHELCQLSCLKFSSNVVEKFIKKLFLIVHDSLGSSSAPSSVSSNSSSVVLNGNSQLCQQQADDVVNVAMGILLTITDIFTANLNVLIRDNFGNYALQTLLDVKNYSQLLEIPGNNCIHSSQKLAKFSHEFTLKVGNLIVLTKELLPSIKTTTYAKKIKLKVKAYAELTGVAFTDLSPKKGQQNSGNNSNSANSHRKQHARRFSLPANSFRHQKGGNNIPMNNGYSVSQAPHPTQQYQHLGMMAMPQKLNFSGNQLPHTQQQPQPPQQLSHRPIFAQSQHLPLPSQTPPSHKAVTNRLHYQPQHQQMQPQSHDYLPTNFVNTHSAYVNNLQAAPSSDHFAYEQSKQNWHQHHQQHPQQLHHRISQPQQPHQSQHPMSQSHANINDAGFLLHSSTPAAPSMLAMNNSTPVTTSSQQPLYMTNNTQIEYHMNMGSGFYH